jgi:hypothetical protein
MNRIVGCLCLLFVPSVALSQTYNLIVPTRWQDAAAATSRVRATADLGVANSVVNFWVNDNTNRTYRIGSNTYTPNLSVQVPIKIGTVTHVFYHVCSVNTGGVVNFDTDGYFPTNDNKPYSYVYYQLTQQAYAPVLGSPGLDSPDEFDLMNEGFDDTEEWDFETSIEDASSELGFNDLGIKTGTLNPTITPRYVTFNIPGIDGVVNYRLDATATGGQLMSTLGTYGRGDWAVDYDNWRNWFRNCLWILSLACGARTTLRSLLVA